MIEACLVGITGYASTHLKLLDIAEEEGRLHFNSIVVLPEIAALVPVQGKLEALKARGVDIFDSLSAMFESKTGQLDLCLLPTSIASHEPLTRQALQAGCHVLVEKPVAGSSEEVRRMIDARNEAGLHVAVGFQDISRRDVHKIKAGLSNGTWGSLESISMTGIWKRDDDYFTRNTWAGKLQHGDRVINDSPINNAFAHFLNNGLFLAGDRPLRSASVVSVEGDLYRCRDIESFDTPSVLFTLDNGLPFRFTVSHCGQSNLDEELSLDTDRGSIVISNFSIEWRPKGSDEIQSLLEDDIDAGRYNMINGLLDQIEQKPSPYHFCSLEIGAEHVKAIEMLHRSLSIKSLDAARLQKDEKGFLHLDGLEEAIHQAREKNQTFKELQYSP